MSIQETVALDMSAILLRAYDVGDMINASAELADYLYWKQAVDADPEAQRLIGLFAKAKEKFEECERFGHFHPNYHEALEKVQQVQAELDKIEPIARFKAAEEKLDDLLFAVSETIAYAVSDTIKVPGNKQEISGGCNCSTGGGSCGGKCG
jgi:cell fate (sporulation/competence/biofilm development) regulator YlbF (YheA/YmcA/DUF963 family)